MSDPRQVLCWGLGPVGLATAAWLAQRGFYVTGVDLDADRVAAVNDRRSPLAEPDLDAAIAAAVHAGLLRAAGVQEGSALVSEAAVSLLCVGTPGGEDSRLDDAAIRAAGRAIGAGLRAGSYHVIAVRSTVMPGTVRGSLADAIASASGLAPGAGFGLACWPEFMREGSALADVASPSLSVIGALDEHSASSLTALAGDDVRVVGLETAELLKLACNSFHALKVAFANEVGRTAAAAGADSALVLELLRSDTRLNASGAYLRPGFAFGGPCLPKDVAALATAAGAPPLLGAILPANTAHLEASAARIAGTGATRVALLGVTFKPGTADVRGSATLALARELEHRGIAVLLHDPHAAPDAPELLPWRDRVVPEAGLAHAELLVITQRRPAFEALATRLRLPLLDLAAGL